MPCTLVRSCLRKTYRVLDGLAAHQNVRSYDVSFLQEIYLFSCFNMKLKRSLYIGQSDASTTKLANGTRTTAF